jgi:NADH dehydrogenase FAD-containing subunit
VVHPRLGIDAAASAVPRPFDSLLVASGAGQAYFARDEWAPSAPGLKTLDDAPEIRRRVLLAFKATEGATSAMRGWCLRLARNQPNSLPNLEAKPSGGRDP